MNAQNSSGSGSGNDGGNSNSISNTSTNTNTSGRALLTNSVLHRQVTLIVRALRKSPDDPAICLRALRALLLVLRENGAACCRQYEEALVENMIPPLMAHPEDPALCETALAALAVLSQSPTLPPPEAPLCGLLVYLLERNAEHAKVRYLILCVLNNLALDVFLPNDLRFRLDSAFAALLLGKDCASDPRLCAACLGAICNCSRCVAPATGKLVEAVLGALTNHGGDSAVLCVGAMALGNLVRQGDTAMDAALRFCAVGRIAGLLRGHCRAAVAMTTASSPPSSHLYATLIEVIGDIAAEACARKRESSVAAMEDVVTALLDVLRTRAGGPKAAVQALRALRILCAASPANRAFAVQSSGVEITLGAGKQSPENVALCVGAARALQNMLLLDAAQDVARKAGVVGFAGDALRRLAKLPRACYHFLSLVSSATISGENKKAAGEAGIVDTVVDVIEWYSNKDTRVCERGCLTLSVITTNSIRICSCS